MARLPKNLFEHYIFSPYALPVCNDFLNNTSCDSDCSLAHPRVFAQSFPSGVVICCQNYVKYGDCSCKYTFVNEDQNLELFFHPPRHICLYLENHNDLNGSRLNSSLYGNNANGNTSGLLLANDEDGTENFVDERYNITESCASNYISHLSLSPSGDTEICETHRSVAVQVSPKFLQSRKLEVQNKATVSVEIQTNEEDFKRLPQLNFRKSPTFVSPLPIRPPGFPGSPHAPANSPINSSFGSQNASKYATRTPPNLESMMPFLENSSRESLRLTANRNNLINNFFSNLQRSPLMNNKLQNYPSTGNM